MPSLRSARGLFCAVALVAIAAACTDDGVTASPTPRTSSPASPTATASPERGGDGVTGRPSTPEEFACAMPHEQLLRVWRGTRRGASGNVLIVPQEPNYLGAGFSHAGPWDYVQEVPLFFYGPGFISPVGSLDDKATLVDIAPTQAELLDFDFNAPDGTALHDALVPPDERPTPPRLIVTLVWDGAGRNVLETWPKDWPNLHAMIPEGAWFDRASIGSSPSNTPPTHASIGTGAWPRHHGIIDLYQRVDGRIVKPQDKGPDELLLPTLADLYDVANDNEPLVGIVATLGAHTGMIGHGSAWRGGDRDLAVMREQEDAETAGAEGVRWKLTTGMAPYFTMPNYINDVPGLAQDVQELDRADGMIDGKWGEHPFSQLEGGFQSPARVPYEMRIVREVVEREGFGADDVPDLLFINVKSADSIGHVYSTNGKEMGDTVRALDASLPELVDMLNQLVGKERWAFILTADHGHQYDPKVSGAFQIGIAQLADYIDAQFGGTAEAPIVKRVRPTQVWINEANLAASGATLDDVSMSIMQATQAETADVGVVPTDPNATVFSAAFPTESLSSLPCLDERP